MRESANLMFTAQGRQRGALELLRTQALLVTAQVIAPLAAIVCSPWLTF